MTAENQTMKGDIPSSCVAAVFSDVEIDQQLKDIEKFMRDHGAEPEPGFGEGALEDKVASIIRELRNMLKETITEG
jgi:hypothetical protein